MKNILVILILFISFLPANADILALSSHSIKYYGIGVINLSESHSVYKNPSKNSQIIGNLNYKKNSSSAIIKSDTGAKTSYIAYIPSANIALLPVETIYDDGWYNVYLNQKTGETGWIYSENSNNFFTYKSLFYKYGKPFGLKMFNDLPDDKKILYAKQSTNSQHLEQLSFPKYINFTVIMGNWILLTVNDLSTQAKVGWYQWRNDDGSLNMFPNFKEQL